MQKAEYDLAVTVDTTCVYRMCLLAMNTGSVYLGSGMYERGNSEHLCQALTFSQHI